MTRRSFYALSTITLFAQPNRPSVRTFISYGRNAGVDNGNRWRDAELIYLTSDFYWLRLLGSVTMFGQDILFNYREGHSQDVGRWEFAPTTNLIRAQGQRYYMGFRNQAVGPIKEECSVARRGTPEEYLTIRQGSKRIRMRLLIGQRLDDRALAAIDDERSKRQ